MNLGYSLAVEKLCGMKLPEKAQVIRVIIAELNRIASHLVGMGAYGLDLGTFSPFLYAFREREMILDLFEEVCGARLTYSYITIGGVHDDLPDGWVERCQQFLDYLKPRIAEYHTLLTTQPHLRAAHGRHRHPVEGDGPELRLHRPDAARLARPHAGRPGLGPAQDRAVLRLRELRLQVPSCRRSTRSAPPEAVIGDCWHRFYVRMLEVVESIKLVEQGLQALPDGPGVAPHRAAASTCRPARPTSRRSARAGRWASTSSAGRRKDARAAARAGAVVELLQPERDQRDLPRLPDRRRAGHRRQHRHRHGRD